MNTTKNGILTILMLMLGISIFGMEQQNKRLVGRSFSSSPTNLVRYRGMSSSPLAHEAAVKARENRKRAEQLQQTIFANRRVMAFQPIENAKTPELEEVTGTPFPEDTQSETPVQLEAMLNRIDTALLIEQIGKHDLETSGQEFSGFYTQNGTTIGYKCFVDGLRNHKKFLYFDLNNAPIYDNQKRLYAELTTICRWPKNGREQKKVYRLKSTPRFEINESGATIVNGQYIYEIPRMGTEN